MPTNRRIPLLDRPECRVCSLPTETIYRSEKDAGLTSSAAVIPVRTMVDLCRACGHAQTRPLADLATYYSSKYNFRTASPDEDDLCSVGAKLVFRSQVQAGLVGRFLDLAKLPDVLDYGCGKAATLRILSERYPSIRAHAFDVSDSYRGYWDDFISAERQASFQIPADWNERFDAVLSFFALEHAESPRQFVGELRRLLKPAGHAFVILPDMYGNVCDFLVVDHVNHFSRRSLTRLFHDAGFGGVSIDRTAQVGWNVVHAQLQPVSVSDIEPNHSVDAEKIADFWKSLEQRIHETEAKGLRRVAIYGSGIYGLFIANTLSDPSCIVCFLDQNKFRQGLSLFGAPVVSPEALPEDVELLYVGLNPMYSRAAIEAVPTLRRSSCELFFV